jgi:hypothetical protein
VRQQLQESQLLQHLGTAMDAAEARLKAAVAALAAATSNSGSSSSTGGKPGSSPTEQVSTQQLTLDVMGENFQSSCLLKLLLLASYPLSTTAPFSIQAALPAAPAAMRLVLTVFQNHHLRPQVSSEMQLFSQSNDPLPEVHRFMLSLACGIGVDVEATLRSCPEASELLSSPELLSCLAIMLVVIVLGLDTSTDDTDHTPRQQLQQADSSSSSSGLSNGMRLDSLTPLSCSLFDVLGVTKETALQAAGLAHSQGLTSLFKFKILLASYNGVLNYQVRPVYRFLTHTLQCAVWCPL